MPNLYFLTFELLMLVLLGLCAHHAWQAGGPSRLWQLLAGVIFGLLLEWATIQQLHAYQYGQFALMLGEVPVGIGIGWGVIIYSARLFSDATSLPVWARPVLDALIALNIDLSMDAIAIRLGMWDWGRGLTYNYFGVPYANFWAWFWVVFSFSAGIRLLARPNNRAGRWLGPAGAVLIGVIGVLTTNRAITSLVPGAWRLPVIALTLGSALLVVLVLRPRLHTRPTPALVFWVPFGFHVYFISAGLLSGVIRQPPVLLLVSLLMFVLALALHWPVVRTLWQQAGKRLS